MTPEAFYRHLQGVYGKNPEIYSSKDKRSMGLQAIKEFAKAQRTDAAMKERERESALVMVSMLREAIRYSIDILLIDGYSPEGDLLQQFDIALNATQINVEAFMKRKLEEALPQWQPIKTAPKDGTPILLLKTGYRPVLGMWYERAKIQGRWVSCIPDEVFTRLDTKLQYLKESEYTPDLWQPIPQPPKVQGMTQ